VAQDSRGYSPVGWEGKRLYQRNMLIGMAAAVLVSAITAVAVGWLLPQAKTTIIPTSHISDWSQLFGGGGGGTPGRGLSAHSLSGGFVSRPRIVNCGSVGTFVAVPIDVYTEVDVAALEPAATCDGDWFGSGEGGGFGDGGDFGLPSAYRYLPPVPPTLDIPDRPTDGVIDNVDPNIPGLFTATGYLNFPTLAKDSDTGYVVWAFVVDRKGRIDMDAWELLVERPVGRGFAEAVRQYIIFGTEIRPHVIGGERKAMRLEVSTMCCKTCDPSVEVVRGDIEARVVLKR